MNANHKSCEDSWYGCCPDGKTAALGADNAGCPSMCGCNKLGKLTALSLTVSTDIVALIYHSFIWRKMKFVIIVLLHISHGTLETRLPHANVFFILLL
jgi:hypothetical protein